MASHDKILIVDFGSQVTQLIARRVREEKVYCEIVPFQKAEDVPSRALQPKGDHTLRRASFSARQGCAAGADGRLSAGVPVLGICYGEQAMAQQLGGKVEGGHHREFGRAEVELVDASSR